MLVPTPYWWWLFFYIYYAISLSGFDILSHARLVKKVVFLKQTFISRLFTVLVPTPYWWWLFFLYLLCHMIVRL